jgi:peroxiredoxin
LLLVSSFGAQYTVEVTMLGRGDMVPHFEIRTLQGQRFSYSSIWQKKNLLLVTLPTLDAHSVDDYLTELEAGLERLGHQDLEYVITRDPIAGLSASTVLVADIWGEIVFTAEDSEVAALPAPRDVLEWVNYLNHRCPECEGEAR